MSNQAVISAAVAPIHKQPAFSSEMITQGLMWESVELQEETENWRKIRMEDNYQGWIHSFHLESRLFQSEDYITITQRAVFVFHEKEKLSSIVAILSFGTRVPLGEKTNDTGRSIYQVERKVILILRKKLL